MKTKNRYMIASAIGLACALVALAALPTAGAGDALSSQSRLAGNTALVERGRYLVHSAVLCIDCHSPRNERGEHIEDRHLTGSPIPFAPTVEMPFALAAPSLAGLPVGYTEETLVHFLMTGERPNGMPGTLPPMPPYRLDRSDAEAVVAYIHYLPANPGE